MTGPYANTDTTVARIRRVAAIIGEPPIVLPSIVKAAVAEVYEETRFGVPARCVAMAMLKFYRPRMLYEVIAEKFDTDAEAVRAAWRRYRRTLYTELGEPYAAQKTYMDATPQTGARGRPASDHAGA